MNDVQRTSEGAAAGAVSPAVEIPQEELTAAGGLLGKIISNVELVIFGKRETIELVLVAMLADGHVLLEDVPGVGKTMLARALARSISADFRRIQFTPDLLPADVTGSSIYNQKTQEFSFRRGPLFANIILADEINRTSPRTQSALLEGMEERQVTVDGVSYELQRPLFVIATQNPIEHQGTYDLPEAQLDRFMLRVGIGYPSVEAEAEILEAQRAQHPVKTLTEVASPEEIVGLQDLSRRVFVKPSLRRYVAELSAASREHADVQVGVSVRGSRLLMHAAQAFALIQGRSYVIPDDIQAIAHSCLCHRLVVRPEARLSGATETKIVDSLLDQLPVPRQ